MFFRAYYAIPPLTTEAGLPTNALYGFTSMCIRLLREEKPEYMAFCYDRPDQSFRSEMYEDYKANRTIMPDDLEPQIPYIHKLTDLLGIKGLDKKGYEADDLIGTFAKMAEKEDIEVVIVSGDKDFAQLISKKISMYDTMKNKTYDPKGVVEKWGIQPEQMIDYLAMVGDSSDNIPGVRGVGPKGAQKLLAEYKTLEGIYNNIDKIKGATQAKLIEGKESAYLAKDLVTIVTDLDLGMNVDDLKIQDKDIPGLKALFEELEFSAMLKKIESAATDPSNKKPEKKAKKKTQKKTISVKVGANPESLNIETWTAQQLQDNIEPYSEFWGVQSEHGVCFSSDGAAFKIDAEDKQIGEILSAKDLAWKGFNLKGLWHDLGIQKPVTPAWDNMLASYVMLSKNSEKLETAYEAAFGEKLPELMGIDEILKVNIQMESSLKKELKKRNGLQVLEKMELPLVPILYDMEKRGVNVDTDELARQSKVLETDIAKLEKKIYKLTGEEFNIASPKQLGVVLFEKIGIPAGKKTKTGYSTGADVLEKNAKKYPVCQAIIDFRELSKLKSTYVDALPELVNKDDGRLHTYFHQALTATGRLSSTNPNLQNIPIRTERGRMVRKAFVAPEGKVMLSIDYSQIELRVLAEISGDPGLQKAFQAGHDVHAATASEVFGVKIQDVTPEQRRMAKAVNFGLAYGQGVYGLADTLDIERSEAKEIIENYFLKFKKVKDYMLDTVQVAKEQGYVETLFGRRRYLPELESSSSMMQKFGERAAINAPMQGTASDLVKLAMIEVFESVDLPMLLQVHDELLFECPVDEVDDQVEEISEIMEGVGQFSVPLKVNAATGANWDEAH